MCIVAVVVAMISGATCLSHNALLRQRVGNLRSPAIRLCDVPEEASLMADLKQAVSSKLGSGDLADAMKPEDKKRYIAGSNAMADAIREAKEKLARRKDEIGEDAALAELDDSIKSKKTS